MSILTAPLPTAIEVNGNIYKINTDFRVVLNIFSAYDDPELAEIEKQIILLQSLFSEEIDRADLVRVGELAADFIAGGSSKNMGGDGDIRRYYSFEKDAKLIFAAFQQTHGIDLQEVEHLHWWKFMALFTDLGADTVFCSLIGLRKRVATGEATKEERKAAREMGDAFNIDYEGPRSVEEIEAERRFMALVNKGDK